MTKKNGTPQPTRRQALLGSLAAPLRPAAAVAADDGTQRAIELVAALNEYATLCQQENDAKDKLQFGLGRLKANYCYGLEEARDQPETSKFAEFLRSQSRKLHDLSPTRKAVTEKILKLMDGRAQAFDPARYPWLKHIRSDDGILTPDSFTEGTAAKAQSNTELLSEFAAKESAILQRHNLNRRSYEALQATLKRIAPDADDRALSGYMDTMMFQVPEGTHWAEHFSKRGNIDAAVKKLQQKWQDEQEREKRLKKSDARNARLGIISTLQDLFKLKFSYSRGEFRAEAPLHGNEEIQRFHAAIERIVTLTNTDEETLKVPPAGYFFVQDRIENLEGKKCRTPPMLAVPRLQEFRLNEKIAQRLADVIDRLQKFPEVPSHREYEEDPIACYREHRQRMADYYGGIADSLETLRGLGHGVWVNRIGQWKNKGNQAAEKNRVLGTR